MKRYIKTLLEEKDVNLNTSLLECDGHIGLTIEMLIDFINSTGRDNIKEIEATFRKIDFFNGNVMHYVNFLANAMVKSIN